MIERIREDLLAYGESLGAEKSDRNDGKTTVLKLLVGKERNVVYFHKVTTNGLRIRVARKFVSGKELEKLIEWVDAPGDFTALYILKSREDKNNAEKLIENAINEARKHYKIKKLKTKKDPLEKFIIHYAHGRNEI